ncbi:MAG: KGK domain-containing protein [Rivularia sp. (in: cyanobacteria)]
MSDNNLSISLDCDDDVVLFEKDTFKVSRLKELMITDVRQYLDKPSYNYEYAPSDILQKITIGEQKINIDYIKFENTKDCQILQINNKGWQKGKLNIEICISPDEKKPDKVNLKFFPQQPIKPESPLDDMREMIQVTDGA